ncbi:hypothetical protein ACS0TY_000632 [Phlomoides rotata]
MRRQEMPMDPDFKTAMDELVRKYSSSDDNESAEVPVTTSVHYDYLEDMSQEDAEEMLEGISKSTIWKVKCTGGLERVSAVMLMQKYGKLGAKLPIKSACALDHVNGFIFVEAEKKNDVYEACHDLPYFYLSSVSRSIGISGSMLARVENFKSNLAQMMSIHHGTRLLPPSSGDLHGEEKHAFMSYERPEEHNVAKHLINMIILWREIDADVSDYAAARKTIETIPDDWRDRAEQLYNKQVVYTSTADAPIINFPHYVAELSYWWFTGRIRGEEAREEAAM